MTAAAAIIQGLATIALVWLTATYVKSTRELVQLQRDALARAEAAADSANERAYTVAANRVIPVLQRIRDGLDLINLHGHEYVAHRGLLAWQNDIDELRSACATMDDEAATEIARLAASLQRWNDSIRMGRPGPFTDPLDEKSNSVIRKSGEQALVEARAMLDGLVREFFA